MTQAARSSRGENLGNQHVPVGCSGRVTGQLRLCKARGQDQKAYHAQYNQAAEASKASSNVESVQPTRWR